jgi:hypothetical protein
MSAKHTPGPWNYGVIRDVLEFQPEWEDASDDRLDADARLIAAAPEILAALECITDALSPPRNAEEEAAIAAALAALAKAKGEA